MVFSGQRLPYDEQYPDSDSSGSASEKENKTSGTLTEIQQILVDIKEIVNCLYELAIAIRNPLPRDRLLKSAEIDVSHFVQWDVRHVEHKVPRASPELIRLLGRANSRRRQLFKYRQRHHSKLSHKVDHPSILGASMPVFVTDQASRPDMRQDRNEGATCVVQSGPNTIATTMNTQTTVATFLETDEEVLVDDQLSETSSAVSEVPDEQSTLQVPAPPKNALDGEPFECPYCFEMMKISSAIHWR